MYDFISQINRAGQGASKWDGMKRRNPSVPDGIIPFSIADMEFKTAPEIIAGLQAYLNDLALVYTNPAEVYFGAVVRWMRERHGWDIQSEWISTSKGVVPALSQAIHAFTEPEDGIIIMPPVYNPFFRAIKQNKRRIIANNLRIDHERYVIDFDDLAVKAKDPRNKVLLFCSPHNPVGRVWEKAELERIGAICLENNVLIISDEIHFDLIMPGFTHTIFAALSDELAENMITCTAPSKTFNMAGIQTSNIIIKNQKMREQYQQDVDRQLNILGYKACEIAYTQCSGWLDALLIVLDHNKRVAEDFIKRHIPQIKVFNLEGTYLQWWDCRGLGLNHHELEHFMTQDALLFLSEGYTFGEIGRGYERINLACPTVSLESGLERLEAALKSKKII
ncbi:MAG: pyridoxal phosphate-dependent aminotransferase [Treponema sp.]|jgi:aminotransferase/cystathionine beta-lyase|nr:pyridoxal phosphate-dependent aminotransferase [Treponema sp.]